MPAIVEADDDGLYVLKFRGAGQGVLALTAELIAGEIGRALGLRVPELVFATVDAALSRNEGDPEIRQLLQASTGMNLAMDYLPGSVMFEGSAGDRVDAQVASLAVWFDSFVTNVDRTPRNPNLLCWHHTLYFIDHGAALYFHHDWRDIPQKAKSRFPVIRDHVLLPWATNLEAANESAGSVLTEELFSEILSQVPDEWLTPEADAPTPADKRKGYLQFLTERLAAAPSFVEEALNARARFV